MERLRIGIVGAQFAAHLHLQNYRPLRGSKVEIVAVASRTKAKAEEFAAKHQIPAAADDFRRLLERKDVDAVDLCVPTDLHHEFIILAAQAGKHVICEKPLTGYFGKERPEDLIGAAVDRETMFRKAMENCAAVAKAVNENKVKFCYAENWVYAPPVIKLKRLMQASQGRFWICAPRRATPAPMPRIPAGGRRPEAGRSCVWGPTPFRPCSTSSITKE